jgi:hypothetical protein
MNAQEKEEFAIAFKEEWLKNRGFDILYAELKTIGAHGSGFIVEKIAIEPYVGFVGFERVPYCVTVNFLTSETTEHERMRFYANFPKRYATANIQNYQILSWQ